MIDHVRVIRVAADHDCCQARTVKHGYTNRTRRRAEVVRKSYDGPDAVARQAAEECALTALADSYPLPSIVATGPGWIETGFVAGDHGQDLIDDGAAATVLSACGRVLAELHRIDARVLDRTASPRAVIRHGDFGPNNILLDRASGQVSAVLDWEFSGVGDAIADVAWCEWIVRMHHPTAVDDLAAFFDAYGDRPSWAERQQEMVRRCDWLADFSRRWEPGGPAVDLWRQRRAVVETWAE